MTPWQNAWQQALYGPDGFYRRPEGPAGHFRTAAHAAPGELAGALARLASRLGAGTIVDVGAGRGELLTALVPSGVRLWGVDVVERPPGLPPAIGWAQGLDALPDQAFDGSLVIAWELLDVIPLTVAELDESCSPSIVLVEPRTGREQPGGAPEPEELAWRATWWPGGEEGDRVEVGLARDLFWRDLVHRARTTGARAALCVDYAHTAGNRPAQGSLSGFRNGREVPPRPDGSMDVTAHVAIDAVAAATGLPHEITTQAEALAALGVTDTELLDPGGLGGFAWLLHTF
ncbi:SAM-dependent methyltransferase [Kineosporia sp. J2-2]|uniref:SAM-dependent methyltransferase n=1 Tax=Kineosporia corallincola TaxID=2835133 RepID=A0ABS5TBY3_9ACTN|nr:SAM-dependent methyltransferase [Kineosporia corallincola]MBT0767711.1 SAM-dependent methyltransferase [Kineosporia corallincola]